MHFHYFFAEASQHAGILNARDWLANHAIVAGPALCNTDHCSEFFRVVIESLSMQRLWATDENRKCAVFLFNFSSDHHIYIVKSLFTSRDDYLENLGETTVLACEMFTSGWGPWLNNVVETNSKCCENIYEHSYLKKNMQGKYRVKKETTYDSRHGKSEFCVQRKQPSTKRLLAFGLAPYSRFRTHFSAYRPCAQ